MPHAKPLVIVDLDGTLLAENSFPLWVKFMLWKAYRHHSWMRRAFIFLWTVKIMLERKLLRHSHAITKRRLQKTWAKATASDKEQRDANSFTEQLMARVRPNLQGLLQAIRDDKIDAVLATAAAYEYAELLGKKLGFTHIITTPHYFALGWSENVRAKKRERVLEYLEEHGWKNRRLIALTDHEEDLPLIGEAALTLWFGEEKDMPKGNIVAAREMDGAEILNRLSL